MCRGSLSNGQMWPIHATHPNVDQGLSARRAGGCRSVDGQSNLGLPGACISDLSAGKRRGGRIMVWSISYRPNPSSYPLAEVVEGNSGELELVDNTPDGGVCLNMSRGYSGRRVLKESVPTILRWTNKRRLLDYETSCQRTVSDRFRKVIEQIEPNVHQFEKIEFISRDGSHLADRWFWQICNRIDSVDRARSNLVLEHGVVWGPPPKPQTPIRVFDLSRLDGVGFWHDKHSATGTFVSDAAKTMIEAVGITGVHFKEFNQG